jgi:23S rRNA (guanine745-N1)-methyltransferase
VRATAALVCPVRACGKPLTRPADGRILACSAGHAFDVARSGYVNLLQPQDKRSRRPGDAREAILARRRVAEAGLDPPVAAEAVAAIRGLTLGGRPAVLDVGCGDGAFLESLSAALEIDAHGVDISVPAIELAARRLPPPAAVWVVANADRRLPWADGSFDVVTSVMARRNRSELARVLRPKGLALVAVPGEDDLVELREAVQGEGRRRDRSAVAIEELAPDFTLVSRRTLRTRARLDVPALRDLLAATYRGARLREQARTSTLRPMEVTSSRDVLVFHKGSTVQRVIRK